MEWTNLIPWGMTLATVIIAIITLSRNGRKDRKEEYVEQSSKIHEIEQSLIKVNVKLDQLCVTTTETRSDIKAMNQGLQEMDKRVTTMENDMKTMWMRIDELKEKVGFYHEGH